MSGPQPAAGRFLGRPDDAHPGFVPDRHAPAGAAESEVGASTRRRTRSAASQLWLVQALTGGFLLVFLGVHLVAQHLLAPGGLRDYAAVVAYLREPLALVAELGLLVSVIVHACVGIRSSLVDVTRDPSKLRIASIGIALVGFVAGLYAVWLTLSVIATAHV
jgi:succinate dehydrogenase hydrophobic anchor subunit